MGKLITIRLSPEAKKAWRWLHTWLGVAAMGAPFVWDNLDGLKEAFPAFNAHWLTVALVSLMIYNSMREKK